MQTARVLVAYGSRNQATTGIAEEIATTLRKDGHDAMARSAADVDSLAPYDAVIVGGALYANRWQRDARRFVRRLDSQLRDREVWFFSSGPLDASAAEKDIPPVRGVRRAMRRVGAHSHITFGGRLSPDARGRIARNLVKRGLDGDWRNFDQIRNWAHEIAAQLLKI